MGHPVLRCNTVVEIKKAREIQDRVAANFLYAVSATTFSQVGSVAFGSMQSVNDQQCSYDGSTIHSRVLVLLLISLLTSACGVSDMC